LQNSASSELEPRGVVLVLGTPEQLGKYVAADTERWKKVVREAGTIGSRRTRLSASILPSFCDAPDGISARIGTKYE